MKNLKKILAILCVTAVCISDRTFVFAAETTELLEATETVEPTEETETVEPTEETETVEPTEETETVEPTEETETVEPTEETETVEPAEETETVEPTEETETKEAKEALELTEDGDPQSGTSMSNSEQDITFPGLFSFFQQSSYTGYTYLHNSRFDNGFTVVNGIDVSSHNGSIDWGAVKSHGIEYAIIRAGYRTMQSGTLGEDTNFRSNIQGALNAGLKVGVYIFSQAISEAEAIEEANYILNKISGYNVTLPVVIDYEYGPNNTGRLAAANLNINAATAVCAAFCNTIQSAGYTPMIYANKYMLQSKLRGDVLGSYYKIWLANYTTETKYSGNYYAWQYSSSGSVNGVSGNVDCNFFYEQNNYTNSAAYVTKLYTTLLEREPDSSGLSSYANAIVNGNSTAASVADEIVSGTEFSYKNFDESTYVSKIYQALLGRTPGSAEIQPWINMMNNGVSRRYVLINVANSGEFMTVCSNYGITQGALSATENRDINYGVTAYVSRCYAKILNRPADKEGLNTWSGKLVGGINGGSEIVKDLITSGEFKNKAYSDGEGIDILYRAMLGRESDAAGKTSWLNCTGQGLSLVYVVNGFAGSDEFNSICSEFGIQSGKASVDEARDINGGVTAFVNRCYMTVLERPADKEGLNTWASQLVNKHMTPEEVEHAFVFSGESVGKNRSDEAFIEILYQSCLDRASDAVGKSDWMRVLQAGRTREEVLNWFVNSAEFQSIVASYGL